MINVNKIKLTKPNDKKNVISNEPTVNTSKQQQNDEPQQQQQQQKQLNTTATSKVITTAIWAYYFNHFNIKRKANVITKNRDRRNADARFTAYYIITTLHGLENQKTIHTETHITYIVCMRTVLSHDIKKIRRVLSTTILMVWKKFFFFFFDEKCGVRCDSFSVNLNIAVQKRVDACCVCCTVSLLVIRILIRWCVKK